jgi:hypothetical protein
MALFIVGILLTGCQPPNETTEIADGESSIAQSTSESVEFLPIRFLEQARPSAMQGEKPQFLPIYKGEKLHLILGTVKLNEFTSTLAAFDLSGREVWRIDSTYGDKNPRPYKGRNVDSNKRQLHLLGGNTIADHDGDSIEDVYATSPKGSLKNHIAIISGGTGDVIVQSGASGQRRVDSPTAVYDSDGDGVNDFHFVSVENKTIESVSLSGVDLSPIATNSVKCHPDGRGSFRILNDNLPDETGDNIGELLIRQVVDGKVSWAVCDGATLERIRDLPKLRPTETNIRGFFLSVGKADFVWCSRTGAKSYDGNGFVECLRGEDGGTLWSREADSFGGHHRATQELDAKGKPEVHQKNENLLGKSAIVVPDKNGDGVVDLALCLSMDDQVPQRQRTIVLVSGKDGTSLVKHEFEGRNPGLNLSLIGKMDRSGEPLKIGINDRKDKKDQLMVIQF